MKEGRKVSFVVKESLFCCFEGRIVRSVVMKEGLFCCCEGRKVCFVVVKEGRFVLLL